jgi:hypothetical protein
MILTCDLGSIDRTTNDLPYHVMWVAGFEVQTCMSIFLVHFHGQFRTPRHDHDCEFDGRSNTVDAVKKFLQSCRSMWPNNGVDDVSEPFSGFVVYCT